MNDLFSEVEANELDHTDKVLGQWTNELSKNLVGKAIATKAVAYLTNNPRIYPDHEDVFKVFTELAPKDVKVVIIGQDPYHNGNANGFAFGCKIEPSPSLISIIKAIIKDVGTQSKEYDGQLRHLVKQGVLLLNTVLTVESGTPRSHISLGWQDVTKGVVKHLSDTRQDVVFLLWGNDAINTFKNVINPDKHLVLTSEHPVAAVYNKKDWKCTHFSQTNAYLRSKNIEPIVWL